MRKWFARGKNTLLLYAIVLLMWLLLSLLFENFGGAAQLNYILMQSSFLGIAAAGQNLIMLTGGIDLSAGNMISLSGVLFSFFLTRVNIPFLPGLLLGLLGVMVFGFLNGYCISAFRIPPMVMTLSTATLIQGVELLITNGFPASINHSAFKSWVTSQTLFGMTNTFWMWCIVIVSMTFLLKKTTVGRKLYYYGSNPEATKYAGFHDRSICVFTYVMGSVMFALAGLLLVGYTGQSALNIGTSYQYLSIAAVVLGGTSVNGGKGKYTGTVAGVLILIMIQSILVMLNIDYGGQNLAEGFIILALTVLYASSSFISGKGLWSKRNQKHGLHTNH